MLMSIPKCMFKLCVKIKSKANIIDFVNKACSLVFSLSQFLFDIRGSYLSFVKPHLPKWLSDLANKESYLALTFELVSPNEASDSI